MPTLALLCHQPEPHRTPHGATCDADLISPLPARPDHRSRSRAIGPTMSVRSTVVSMLIWAASKRCRNDLERLTCATVMWNSSGRTTQGDGRGGYGSARSEATMRSVSATMSM